MTTWHEVEPRLAIDPTEKDAIKTLAFPHAERIKHGISLEMLAKRLDISQIEDLMSIPSQAVLDQYAEGLGITLK